MPVFIHGDYSEVDAELARVASLPGAEVAKLDAAHAMNFLTATAEVDVLTGALKASGRATAFSAGTHWEGDMVWGTLGYPSPVDYAIYEKARGGGHDWLETTRTALHETMIKAMLEVLSK